MLFDLSPIDSDNEDSTRYSPREYTYTSSSSSTFSSSSSLLPSASLFPPRTSIKSSSPSSSRMKRSPATENLFLFTRDAFLEDERRSTRAWSLESCLATAFEDGECFSSPELPPSPLSPYTTEDEDMGLDSADDSPSRSPSSSPCIRRRDFAPPPTRFVRPRLEKLRLGASPESKGGKAVRLEHTWSFEEQLGSTRKGVWGEGVQESRGLGLSFA